MSGILPEHGVFQLQHVDLVQIDLPVNQPGQIVVPKFARGVRFG